MAQYKYLKQNNIPVIVDAAYKDGDGKTISSQYSTKEELTTKATELDNKIKEITGPTGKLSEYRKAVDQDVIDTNILSTTATNLKTHTDNTTVHITSTERLAWNAKYDKPATGIPASDLDASLASNINDAYAHAVSGVGTGADKQHHLLTVQEGTENYVLSVDNTYLAAKYDITGKEITNTYATKNECAAKYTKPDNGIPKTDLISAVQTSLDKADNAATSTDLTNEITRAQEAESKLVPKIEGKGLSTNDYTNSDKEKVATALQPSALTGYATETWVESKGYLTSHQDISGKVDKKIVGANGTAEIFNESDGGGAHFIHKDTSEAFVGVNDGGKTGMMAQIYADIKEDGAWKGSRINVYHDGIYYVSKANQTAGFLKNDSRAEIAIKHDIPTKTSDLTNDSGYITTEVLTDYSTTAEMNAAINNHHDSAKLNIMPGDAYTAGNAYNLPYFFETAASADYITVTAKTVTLDGNNTHNSYSLSVPSATTVTAGLLSATDKTKLDNLSSNYTELNNKPSINNIELVGNKSLSDLGISIPTLKTLKTPETLTASVTVGAIAKGTVIPAGTSMWNILKQLFEGTSVTSKFYCGTLKTLPTTDSAITEATTLTAYTINESTRSQLLAGGFATTLTPNEDYIIFAVDKASNLTLSDLVVDDDFNTFATLSDTESMHVYCMGDNASQPIKVGDGTTPTTYKFVCQEN